MKISLKWRAALAGAIAIALVGGGAAAANAADGDILNPQSNGSAGSFYIWDGNTGEFADGDPARSYARNEGLIIAGSKTDVLAEIPVPAAAVAGGYDQVYRFVARSNELSGGTNTWRGYSSTFVAGPNGGLLTDDFQLDSKLQGNNGGVDTVFTEGGDWYVGLAFTKNNGVTPIVSIYRTIHVDAATDRWTVDPVETAAPVAAPVVTTQPTSVAVTAGADAVFTAAASGDPTVQWQSSTDGTSWSNVSGATNATLTVASVTVAQSLTKFRAVFTNASGSVTTNEVQLTVTAPVTEPTDATDAGTKQTLAAPVDGVVTLTGVPAGTYTAYAWSTPVNLGSVVVPASGIATITVPSALQDGNAHTIALLQADNTVVAWGNVVVPAPEFALETETPLTAEVTVSGKFALEGVRTAPLPLGTAKRGATTAPVALGAFTVTDDRNDLKGWTLNATVADFTNAAGESIPGSALGLAAKKVGDAVDGVTTRSAAKVAGDEWASTLVAEGAAGSTTLEDGTQFDADLTFKAPKTAKKGTYTSTLTLTLASK